MPSYEGDHQTTIAASAEDAFAVLTDYERLPEWQRALRRCDVISRRPDGLGSEVRYEVDARVRRITYTLRHSYVRPHRILGEYVGGDVRRLEGEWVLDECDAARVTARLWLRIDPGLPIPGPLVRLLHDRVLRTSVEDLRTRLEGG